MEEMVLAKRMEDMDLDELVAILTELRETNEEAFNDLKEVIDDYI